MDALNVIDPKPKKRKCFRYDFKMDSRPCWEMPGGNVDYVSTSRTCWTCGDEFFSAGMSGNENFCTMACRDGWYLLKMKNKSGDAPAFTDKCLECGVKLLNFIDKVRHQQHYCSRECRNKATSRILIRTPKSLKIPSIRVCGECHESFTTYHPCRKFCSVECRIAHMKKSQLAYFKTKQGD